MTFGAVATSSQPAPLPYEEIARLPLPGMAVPVGFAFGVDDRVLLYRYAVDGGLEQRLFALNMDAPGDGPVEVPVGGTRVREENLTLDEQLRRERAREVGTGVTAFSWAERADAVLVPLPDGLHLLRDLAVRPEAPSEVVVLAGDVVAPKLSPDGTAIAFVQGGDLYVVEAAEGAVPVRLTHSAEEGLHNGVAEFVAQEEMDRDDGLWWSKDSTHLAYCEVDERHVPKYRIVHQGSDDVGPGAEESHRYPFAGRPNAKVRLGVVSARGGDTVWMQTGDEDQYLARVRWLRSGRLLAEIESRDQTRVDVVSFDPATGGATHLHAEETFPYVNLHDDFRELASGEWTWSSERTGYRHLELRAATGALVRTLTAGTWQVDALAAVDEPRGVVYFTATKDGVTERHLYAVPLGGGEPRRLTEDRGTHVVVVAERGGVFVDRHGALDRPPTVRVRAIGDGTGTGTGKTEGVLATLHDSPDPRLERLGLEPPEPVTVPADDGTELFGLYYAPPDTTDGAPPPLVVQVYGGPHAQLAVDDWGPTVFMRAQALRRLGFAILVVDNRGSARRGLRFEAAIHRRMGGVEVADQVAGVRWAVASGLADPARVGVFGWSYGGYMALQCLGRAPEMFRAGVAGAPVTHFDGYDTHYTERYMGTPESNPQGYWESSAFAHVEPMGELLLVHGMIDENVHFRHTARLIQRLVSARKRYQLLCFPSERHLPRREEDRAFMEEQVITWLVDRLATPDRT